MPFPDSKSTAWEFFTDDYVINMRAVNHVLKEKTHIGSKQVAATRFSKSA
jgi:hypothetical protein